jgi:outer membrane lipoprotein SlyB
MTKWITILTALSLQGCATAYTVTSTATWVATGKSVTDHVTSKLTYGDCDAVRMITKLTYYCEMTDPSKTYNRTGL